jgi:hypothetical protein
MKKKLLWCVAPNGGVVFAPPDRAIYVARIHQALESSTTWGEFRKAMPRKAYSEIIQNVDDGDFHPKSSDPFTADWVPGYADGDYPPWIQQEMGEYLPKEILERFGTLNDTILNGNFWMIPSSNLDAVCAALTALGYKLECAQGLPFY